jgi:hypothetical protein
MARILFLFSFLVSVSVCAQRQGISGTIVLIEGNQMPGSEKQPAAFVSREIHIYKPVHRGNATISNGLYPSVNGELVKVVESGSDGTFRVKLAPGVYSVFVREKDGLFANISDLDGVINPVRVKRRKFTKVEIQVNYRAFY